MTSWHKIRAGRCTSTASLWRVESRGPRCYAIIDPQRRIASQRDILTDALLEASRLERAEGGGE